MKNLLIATDLSERSERALRRAFKIAERSQAALTVLSVIDDDLPHDIAEQMKAAAEQSLVRLCASLSDYACRIAVDIADPLQRIHDVADETDADLVVLGVHRRRRFADFFGGTTMERLVRASLRPVLLVRDPVDHDYQRAVCGLDLSPSCIAAAEACADCAPEIEIATFHAVHVPFRGFIAPGGRASEMQPFLKEAEAELQTWLASATLPPQCRPPKLVAKSPMEALTASIGETKPHLVCIGAHGRSSLMPTYLGSFTEELLREPPCDLLVVRR